MGDILERELEDNILKQLDVKVAYQDPESAVQYKAGDARLRQVRLVTHISCTS